MSDSLRPQGSSLPGIFPARILVWTAVSFSRASSQPRDRTCVSSILTTAEPPGTTPIIDKKALFQCYVGMEGVPGRCAWRASGRRGKGLNCVILSAFPGRQGGQGAQMRTLRKPVLWSLCSVLLCLFSQPLFLMRWTKLEPIIQSEVSQKDKEHYNILTHIYGI